MLHMLRESIDDVNRWKDINETHNNRSMHCTTIVVPQCVTTVPADENGAWLRLRGVW